MTAKKNKDTEDTVYQYLVPFEERDIEFYDFSNWREKAAHDEIRKWTTVPFKRFHSPMSRIVMIKLPDGYNGVYFKVDHMTMDSSSIITFLSDILEIYCSKVYGTNYPKPMQSYIMALEKALEYEAGSAALKKDAVTEYELQYLYYYLCRVLFRGIENSNRTIGEILNMI